MTRDELVECAAAARAMVRGQLDRSATCDRPAPLDVLAQQLVATCAAGTGDDAGWGDDALFALVRGASPYAALARAEFDDVVAMLGDGIATRRGRSGAHLHLDRVNRRVRGRRGARLAALTSGGAIPDKADYVVVEDPTGAVVGSLDEDFAIESMAGDIFLLGSHSAGASAASRTAWCASRTRPGCRRRCRSGTARGWRAPSSCRARSPSCAPSCWRCRPRRRWRCSSTTASSSAAAAVEALAVRRRGRAGARRGADADLRRRRALLRRRRRHAAGHPRAVRRAHQPRLGPGAAQEVLPRLRLRAAGGGVGRRDLVVDRAAAQLPARRDLRLRHAGYRRGDAGAGGAAVADVGDALALERDARARGPALHQRQAHRRRRSCACARPTSWPPCFPRRRAARTTTAAPCARTWRCPTIRS